MRGDYITTPRRVPSGPPVRQSRFTRACPFNPRRLPGVSCRPVHPNASAFPAKGTQTVMPRCRRSRMSYVGYRPGSGSRARFPGPGIGWNEKFTCHMFTSLGQGSPVTLIPSMSMLGLLLRYPLKRVHPDPRIAIPSIPSLGVAGVPDLRKP